MDDSEAMSLEQIRAFLASSGEVRFAGQRRAEVYVPRRHKLPEGYRVTSTPVLGGLHHEYGLEKEATFQALP